MPGKISYGAPRKFLAGSRITSFRKKYTSRELKTFACPKLDQLVPIYSGPIDPILVYGPNLVFEIILFFPKKISRKWPKLAVFVLII